MIAHLGWRVERDINSSITDGSRAPAWLLFSWYFHGLFCCWFMLAY